MNSFYLVYNSIDEDNLSQRTILVKNKIAHFVLFYCTICAHIKQFNPLVYSNIYFYAACLCILLGNISGGWIIFKMQAFYKTSGDFYYSYVAENKLVFS